MFTNSARSLASKFPHIGRARQRQRRRHRQRHRLIMRFTLLRTKSSSVDELMWPSWSSGSSVPRESEGLWLRKVGQQVSVSSATLCINIYAYSGHTINADADANAYALGQSFVGASQGSKGERLLTLQQLYSQLPPSSFSFPITQRTLLDCATLHTQGVEPAVCCQNRRCGQIYGQSWTEHSG